MPRVHPMSLLAALALAVAAGPAAAAEPAPGAFRAPDPAAPPAAWSLGGAVALLLPGEVTVQGTGAGTSTGVTARLQGDYFLGPRLSVAGLVQASSFEVEGYGSTVIGLGVGLSVHFGQADQMHLRGTLGLQYQVSSSDAGGGSFEGLGVPLNVDLVFPSAGSELYATVGFITQPSGGNADYEVTWGPIFYAGVGGAFHR